MNELVFPGPVTIKSATKERWLALFAGDLNEFQNAGGGQVVWQSPIDQDSVFKINQVSNDGINIVCTIESTSYPGVLRSDGPHINGQWAGIGGTGGPWEQGSVEDHWDGKNWDEQGVAIKIVQFGVFLSLGDGGLSMSSTIGDAERYNVEGLPEPLTVAEIQDAISKWAPVLHFSSQERYNMCPVEWYLVRTTLTYPTGKFINHPGVNQLPNDPSVGAFFMQDNHGVKSGDLSLAVAYVHAQWKPGDQITDIQFWFVQRPRHMPHRKPN